MSGPRGWTRCTSSPLTEASLHLVHPRTGAGQTDDRVFYQRSD